jgi:hypothetical protein
MIHMYLYLYNFFLFFLLFVKKFATTFVPNNYHFVSGFTLVHIRIRGTGYNEAKLEDGANEM